MRKFKRVDLTGATEDYFLEVGEEAYISFSNTREIPLHIATQDGTYYEMHIIPANTGGTTGGEAARQHLYPNNISYGTQFTLAAFYRSGAALASMYEDANGFYLGAGYFVTTAYIVNKQNYRRLLSIFSGYGATGYYPTHVYIVTIWKNQTDPWTSLGTVVYDSTTASPSGEILVRRLR